MWLTKLAHDRLRVITDSGPRYVRLSLTERLRAAWVFRNFSFLPKQVLSAAEQRWFMSVCAERAARGEPGDAANDDVIGTLITAALLHSRRYD